MKSKVENLAREIAAAKKAGGQHVRYPDEIKQRAVALYRRGHSGTLLDFAEQLGISPAGLSKWLRVEAVDAAPMPVKIIGTSTVAGSNDTIILKHRGITVHLPADATPALIARLARALAAEDDAC